jgi:biopolymer transport protein ExbD
VAFGGFSDNKHQAPMAEINVTPMVDVMLVLLVIFIITAPLFTRGLLLDLPTAKSGPIAEKNETIDLSIDEHGTLFWNGKIITMEDLGPHFAGEAIKKPQPDLQLRADRGTRYEVLARVMSEAQSNGINKIGFITDPKSEVTNTVVTPSNSASTPTGK